MACTHRGSRRAAALAPVGARGPCCRLIARYLVAHLGRLGLLQLALGLLAFWLLDHPAAAAAAAAYLGLALLTAHALGRALHGVVTRTGALLCALLVAAVWQAPGLAGTVEAIWVQLVPSRYGGGSDFLDFVMQGWHLPLLPLLARAPAAQWQGNAVYYWLLIGLSPAWLLAFVLSAGAGWTRARPAGRPRCGGRARRARR